MIVKVLACDAGLAVYCWTCACFAWGLAELACMVDSVWVVSLDLWARNKALTVQEVIGRCALGTLSDEFSAQLTSWGAKFAFPWTDILGIPSNRAHSITVSFIKVKPIRTYLTHGSVILTNGTIDRTLNTFSRNYEPIWRTVCPTGILIQQIPSHALWASGRTDTTLLTGRVTWLTGLCPCKRISKTVIFWRAVQQTCIAKKVVSRFALLANSVWSASLAWRRAGFAVVKVWLDRLVLALRTLLDAWRAWEKFI